MPNYAKYDSNQGNPDQQTDLYELVTRSGRYIGSRLIHQHEYRFYVLDGFVYSTVRVVIESQFVQGVTTVVKHVFTQDDYFEFCQGLREGRFADFKGSTDFHLSGKG